MMYLIPVLQFFLVLLFAPLMVGLVRKFKARFQNRRGASIFLPYWTLLSLARKDMTITRHSSWVFRAVPFIVCGTAFALAFIMPGIAYGILPASADNVFVIAGILALGSVFLVLGGMDTGSTFGNMGSSREMTIASLIEPALFIVFASLGSLAASWSMGGIMEYVSISTWAPAVPYMSVTLVALLFIVLAENARYPVDNPATHLELTMVHEAMVLEYSGPYLALLEYASALKLTVLSVFLVSLVAPFGLLHPGATVTDMFTAVPVFLLKVVLAAFALAFIESTIVKMRFYRMQEYAALAFLFAFAGSVLVVIGRITLII